MAATALLAALRERQLEEMVAIEAMYEATVIGTDEASADDQVSAGELGCTLRLPYRDEHAVLQVDLPADYPTVAPRLALSCPALSSTRLAAMKAELTALAAARACGDDGEVCVCELAAELEARLRSVEEEEKEAAEQYDGRSAQTREDVQRENAVVRIDHMNSAKPYVRSLEVWAAQYGLAGRLFYRASGQPGKREYTDILLLLAGEVDCVSSLLQRLRTEYVDVDSRGARCRERQATVLCRRAQQGSAAFSGWATTAYRTDDQLDALLDKLKLLHVGVGSSRFTSANKSL
mmetsp:Transcript_36913/g.77758  ORF Transcript_36913/g.77758 Transcript_36913/m.77758 type:complete len:291 (-) Transcript_36913:155-1027(-)